MCSFSCLLIREGVSGHLNIKENVQNSDFVLRVCETVTAESPIHMIMRYSLFWLIIILIFIMVMMMMMNTQ